SATSEMDTYQQYRFTDPFLKVNHWMFFLKPSKIKITIFYQTNIKQGVDIYIENYYLFFV
ncbi:hypothetical protein, partial [Aeribacillus pallidus]|uniref:hypothetical protein n=1 Tax=Aeribacillus pallidus TaxID=33936 RepID=UPI003D232FFD